MLSFVLEAGTLTFDEDGMCVYLKMVKEQSSLKN